MSRSWKLCPMQKYEETLNIYLGREIKDHESIYRSLQIVALLLHRGTDLLFRRF